MKLFSIFNKDRELKDVEIGGGLYCINIPKKYLSAYDEEGTLLFYPEGEETITIRITVLSFDRKDGKPALGSEFVLKEAEAENYSYEVLDDQIVLSEAPPYHSFEDGTELIMQFWYLGRENSLVIFSSTTLVEQEESREVAEVRRELHRIMRSVKRI